ncbi:uncharacterized protein [Apostichopus japonicus]|uniref:uncharacterized protein isoform X2 n=1 Tax=Stichopus japonicus TaxID=307972 RepID=UPI003AB6B663
MQPEMNNHPGEYVDVGNIVRSGYLKKLKTMRKKFFVIWGATNTTSARLEYYDNEKKFRLGLEAKKSILLSTCFNINRKSDMKNKYVIALYTRDDYFAIVTEDEEQQNEWLRVLLEQQRASGDGRPIPHFEHIWQVTVKSKGLGSSQNLSGNYRLCLTAGTINLVKMNSENGDLQFPLSVVRRCGHSDCFFFMEVGRQAVTGSGEMWMQVEDSVIAQNIHEATLNAMRSSSQNEDMRPRSHSGGTSHSSSSWRMRCDSLPVGSSAGSRLSRTRGNSEGDDGTREDDYANPPSGLLKSSKPRPRTSSEGESFFRGNPTPESPSKTRGRYSMPAIRSASLSSGHMRPMSVHRFATQSTSNSPPIPNSPLSESPRSFTDDRFIPGPNHSVGHSPTDVYKDDHFFSPSYNNNTQIDTIKRYPSISRSRTPDSQFPIQEESTELTDEYMNMAGSSKTSDEHNSYMDMSSTNPAARSSFSGSLGGGGVTSPPTSPTTKTFIPPRKHSTDLAASSPSEPEGYMMMAPSSAKQQRSSSQPQPVPLVTSYDSTPYMYMSPPLPATKKAVPPPLPPSLEIPSTSASLSSESPVSGSSHASNHASGTDSFSNETTQKLESSSSAKETFFDSYANVEFSPVFSQRTVKRAEEKSEDNKDSGVSDDVEKADYMNMAYKPKKKSVCNGQQHPVKLSNGRDSKEPPEQAAPGQQQARKTSTNTAAASGKQNGGDGDYAKMDFNGAEKPLVKVKDTSQDEEVVVFEGDFMNVDRSMGSTRLSLSGPQSPSSLSTKKGSNVTDVLNSPALQHSLEELHLKEKSSLGSKSQSSLLLNRPSSSISGNHLQGTIHPKGSLTPNLNLHHSPVNNPKKAHKYELNYIDVEADSNNTPHKSDSSSPRSPSSPYRAALGNDDKEVEPVTYSTIDFTKSEGLRNVSAMRESRF